ncbi:MAG: MBOAT family protein [Firmicutes bacterium]|nr:MBOAT family protein [Bacillota bacterium]
MLFSSISFLYFYLALILLVYYIVPKSCKNPVLLLASLFFYAYGEPVYVSLLIISSLSDWLHSLYIEAHRGSRGAKRALISSVIINLGMLGFFKYIDFFIGSINAVLGTHIPLTGVPLPIGISFFTFQTMSYTIDVYRGRVKANRNLITFATFVCLFPQLIAGPIVRYANIDAELAERSTTIDDVAIGIRRFCVGLGKKVLIANSMGELSTAFTASADQSVLFVWLYGISFALQIYFDFSGYSDMAIGLGRMFGFHFPENFDHPFMSQSITEFWRRWHMTLGGWFRDYVYFPLGGSRVSRAKWIRNLCIVWALTGLWHGAAWNFVLWGVYFGFFLCIEKLYIMNWLKKVPRIVRHIYLLPVLLVSFVIFNGTSLANIGATLKMMFGLGGVPLVSTEALYYLKSYAVLLLIAAVGATTLPRRIGARISASRAAVVLEPLFVVAIMIVCTAYLVDGSFNPFLYFRF